MDFVFQFQLSRFIIHPLLDEFPSKLASLSRGYVDDFSVDAMLALYYKLLLHIGSTSGG